MRGGCNDVAARVGTAPHRRDRLAELDVEPRLEDARRAADIVEPVDGPHGSGRQDAGACREEANRERPLEARLDELVRYFLAPSLPEGDVDKIDTDAEADERG